MSLKPPFRWPLGARGSAATVVILAALLGAVLLAGRHGADSATTLGEQTAIVQVRPFVANLGVAGTITAGDIIPLIAPFDGKIARLNADYGDAVEAGQVVLTLDASDAIQRRNEAEGEYLKAAQSAADMAAWETSPDVTQALRAETTAELELADTERKIVDTKALLDRGLVARDEYDGLVEQRRNQSLAVAAARQDLVQARARGAGPNRRVAQIEAQTARRRLEDLNDQIAGAVLHAPAGGILVHPQGDKTESGGAPLRVATSVTRGQLIAGVARAGGLAVTFQLSEADANRVRIGQPVEVTGPGFPGVTLTGTISSVGREATPAAASSGGAVSFGAAARLEPLTPDTAAVIRIGMTANVSIEIYRSPRATVAPPGAIEGTAPDTYVTVLDPASHRRRRVAVRIGQVAPDGVEVLAGLTPGDTLVWSAASATGASPDN